MASLIILGDKKATGKVASYILDYPKLVENCKNEGTCSELVDIVRKIDSSSSVDYEIKNKYYSAVVRLCIATSIDKLASRDRDLLDGVIIITPSDEKFLTSPLARDPPTVDQESEMVQLLVSFKTTGGPELSEQERENRLGWSLDHAFEFIELDEGDLMQSWNEREKDGLPRVIEALHAHHWNSSEPVSSASRAPVMTHSSAGAVEEDGSAGDDSKKLSSGAGSGGALPTVGVTSSPASLAPVAVTSAPPPAAASVASRLGALGLGEPEVEDDDLDGLDDLDAQFSNMVAQARSMREVAASGGLTDEQRRERAAEMAMRLCRLIGLEEGSDSDQEEKQ